mmetsp:Transcript_1573/g.2341  ORF Transcript_1573/g.2341 Transcript_1573/m.2341 type:complete len:342 (-) Transcript_1573:2318-3343(-)|eukprot:scaffold7895_cov152-Skeletonema_dohrnii-CCMP3373.AAC.5
MTSEISNHIALLKESFLLAAASGGRLLECQSLLELGADTEYVNDETDETPLLAACRNGHRAVASLLLAHGADSTKCDRENNNVLHIVADTTGDEALASLFCPNASALCSATNDAGKTAIDIAVERGFSAFAEHLHHLCTNNDGNSESDNDTSRSSQSSSDTLPPHMSALAIDDDGYDDSSSNYNNNSDSNAGEDSFDIAAIDNVQLEQQEEESNFTRQLQVQLYQAKYALSAVMKERDDLKAELSELQHLYREDDSFYSQKSLQELQAYERQVKNVLERIEKAKEHLEEEKLCVICRENPKEVLIMPCRHLCVCKECGNRVELTRCPLCREVIAERISVFS